MEGLASSIIQIGKNMDLEIYLKTNLRLKVHLQDMLAAAVSLRSSDSSSTVGCFEKLNSLARPPAYRTYTLFLDFYKNLTASIFCSIREKRRKWIAKFLRSKSCSMSKKREEKKKEILTTRSLCSMRTLLVSSSSVCSLS